MTKIIGISGKASVGKTTLADIIVGMVPGAQRMSFADELRHFVCDLYGFRIQLVRQPLFKTMTFRLGALELSGREILQRTGCMVRDLNPDYWCKRLKDRIARSDATLIVVDDVRFPNELDLIESLGGVVLRLDPYPGWKPGPHADHISETALDGVGFTRRFTPLFGALGTLAEELMDEVAA